MRLWGQLRAVIGRWHLELFRHFDPNGRTIQSRYFITFVIWAGFLALLLICGFCFVVSGVWVIDQTTGTADAFGFAAMALCSVSFAAILVAGFIVFRFDVPCLLNKDPEQWQARLAALEESLTKLEVGNA